MKICIVAPKIVSFYRPESTAQYGGAEAQAAFLAGALSSDGHEVSLVVTDLGPGDKLPYPAENAFDSSRGLPVCRFFYPRLPGIYKALERADADIYYQRNAAMITGVVAWFCRRRKRTFVFGTGSDTDLSFRTVRLNGVRDRLFFHAGLKMAHGIVAQNQFQAELCRRHFDKPVRVIPNGIDLAAGVNGTGEQITWIGALRRVKQPDRFIELAGRLPDYRFVMIGGPSTNETAFSHHIMEEAKRIGNLTLTGHLPHQDVLAQLKRSSILVNTSRVEGFPNAYLEAWSYGVPVVSFNDVDNLIGEEGLGLLANDVEDMAGKIGALLADPVKIDTIRERARSLLRSRFSASVLVKQYELFFQDLLEGSMTSA